MRTFASYRLKALFAGLLMLAGISSMPLQADAQQRATDPCTQASARRTKACLVGNYRLPVRQGSDARLTLHDDNVFKWDYNDPAGRKQATGSWTITASGISLRANQLAPTVPVFELVSQEPWDEVAEFRLRSRLTDRAQAVAESKCPVFIVRRISDVPLPETPAPSETATQNAAKALDDMNVARNAYERAVALTVSGTASQKDYLVSTAEAARNALDRAEFEFKKRYQIAGLPIPILSQPTLPPVCTVRNYGDPRQESQDKWLRGISINLEDVGEREIATEIRVALTYENGRTVNFTTERWGSVFAAFDPFLRIRQIDLSTEAPSRATRRFAVRPTAQGVFTLTVNSDLLDPPPFRQLNLRLARGGFVSTSYLPGKYEPFTYPD
jgi:hypothetical protein